MDRFLTGYHATPPAAKRKKTDQEKQAQYESTRERTFQPSWQKSYTWLTFDSEKNHMKCNVCTIHETTGSFVTGCANLRLEAIKRHNISQGHCDNVKKENAKRHTGLNQSTAGRSLLSLNKQVFDKLSKLFRNAHFIGKMGRPYTDYVSLCQLDTAKSIEIGKTYLTDKACQHFITAIADDCRRKQDNIYKNAPFFSVISDGSTDTSSQEAEILYARTSFHGKISTDFIGLKNVPKADGAHITRALVSMLNDRFGCGWKQKLIAMGTDGASVMLGSTSGVVQRFREETGRQIYAVHCSAHRLELAYKDAIKNVTIVGKCELLLLNLYLFYKYSSLNRANLKASFKSLGQEPLIPSRVGGTRWLPHTKKALQQLIKGYEAVVQHLEQMQGPDSFRKDSSAKARNFLKALKNNRVRLWLHFMLDIVTCLSDVSTAIQVKSSTLSDVWLELQSAKRILSNYVTRDGPSLLKVDDADREPLGSERENVLTSLISALDRRFEGDMELFRGSSILNFKQWQKSEEGYGDEHVQELVNLAESSLTAQGADPDRVVNEWTKLKMKIYDSGVCIKNLAWEDVYDTYETDCPNFLVLVDFLLTIPSSSVDAERGFSRMKFVKNDWRSRLGEKNLTDLMLLYIESPSIQDFNPADAVQQWYTSGQRSRRPNYVDDIMNCSEPVLVVPDGDSEEELAEDFELAGGGELEFVGGGNIDSATADSDDEQEDITMNLRDVMALQKKKYELFCELYQF